MAEDREILQEIWRGRIPVCISLDSDDCNTLSPPDPFYLLVPRVSYFPLVLDKVSDIIIHIHIYSLYSFN